MRLSRILQRALLPLWGFVLWACGRTHDTKTAWHSAQSELAAAPAHASVRPAPTELPTGVTVIATDEGGEGDPSRTLGALRASVAGASIVGLGESIHTSDGFHRARLAITKDLIEHGGFRLVALETPRLQAEVVSRYVATCEGSSVDALRTGVFQVFASTSLQKLIEWMCAWNKARPTDRVHFVGFDNQEPFSNFRVLQTELTRMFPRDAPAMLPSLESCHGVHDRREPLERAPFDPKPYRQCLNAIQAIEAKLPAGAVRADTSAAQLALLGLRSWQGQRFHRTSPQGNHAAGVEARDEAMAQTALALRGLHANAPMVIWAHNFHIRHAHEKLPSARYHAGARNMGSYLREALGSGYQGIGFVAYRVETDWRAAPMAPSEATRDGDIERLLHQSSRPALFVDLMLARVLLSPETRYEVGQPERESMNPAEQYRGLVYLEHSPPMQYAIQRRDAAPGSVP